VRDAELDTALAKLEARGDLSETDREALEDLADSLVESLLAVPVSSLHEADATAEDGSNVDERTVETALELFG
jgi:glutamyl-tRNA reductase